ncbi:MAG TPA: hypothetical protein VFE32_08945 [Puia sp.]|jgi:hypothetical protein|nr:hypothetical protein [Puia sp.]
MGKKVLAIFYSQSGQLAEIVHQLTAPLAEAGASVDIVRIEPLPGYPFPWTTERFYSVMPDCVLGVTSQLAPFTLKETAYDLIVLGYQAWFLYPSIPVNTLLHDHVFRKLLGNTPVITVTGARNMWLNTFLEIKKLIHVAGGRLVGNIALIDRHPNHISFVTIFHWLLGGKKDRYLGIFPPPGVSAADIAQTSAYGSLLVPKLLTGQWEGLQEQLELQHAVNTRYSLLLLESTAIPTYEKWARFIVKRKKRKTWLAAFRYYLLFSLFVAAPILLAVDAALIRPFSSKRIKEKRSHYLSLN